MATKFFVNDDGRGNLTIGQTKKDGFPISLDEKEIVLMEVLVGSQEMRTILQKCAEAGYYLQFEKSHPSQRATTPSS